MPTYNATSGVDTLIADGQDDTFEFQAGTVQAGDHFDAAGGADRMLIDASLDVGFGAPSIDFRTVTLLGFETLEFQAMPFIPEWEGWYVGDVRFNAAQLSPTLSVVGSNGTSFDY